MHITLPESTARRQRSPGGVLLSAVVHAAVIGGTVVATGMSTPRSPLPDPPPETLVFVKSDLPDATDRPQPRADPQLDGSAPRLRPPVQPELLPAVLPEVPSTIAHVDVPLNLAIDPSRPADFDPATAARFVGGRDGAPSGTSPTSGMREGTGPMSALAVEREVVPRRIERPAYPSTLARAGIEGTVVAQFVVDTLGRVERESIEFLSATHPLFARSVHDAVVRMRFDPAESGGRRVRQLVQQSFTFALTGR